MKIYVSHSSNFDYINKLYNPIKSSNLMASNVFFFPHDKHKNGIKTKDIIGTFDLVIAESSLPATGQGIAAVRSALRSIRMSSGASSM